MTKRIAAALLAALLACAWHPASAMPATPNPNLTTHSCLEGKHRVPATCGSFRVFENRATQRGRTIDVHFIVLKAQNPSGKVIYVNLG